jgi:hypothetical protein
MPPFILPDENGRLIGLKDLLAKGPAVVTFHRGHWCPYCRINAHGLAQINNEATAAGGQIVAITPERQQFTTQHKRDAAGQRAHAGGQLQQSDRDGVGWQWAGGVGVSGAGGISSV